MAGSVCGKAFTDARPFTGAEGKSATLATPVIGCPEDVTRDGSVDAGDISYVLISMD